MIRPIFFVCWLSLVACVCLAAPQASAVSLFHYTSEAGDTVGKGQEATITPRDANFFAQATARSITIEQGGSASDSQFFRVEFDAPPGAVLAVGDYPNVGYPYTLLAGQAGMELEVNEIASVNITGQYRILEIRFDADGTLLAFAADLVQHYENALPGCFCQVRYNSDIPYTSAAGYVQLAANHYSQLSTAGGGITIPVTRTGGSTGAASVTYTTADGTDLAGRDYTATSGTLTWADGDTTPQNIFVPILDSHDPYQGNGTFTVTLGGTGTGVQTQATVTVINDDSAITVLHFTGTTADVTVGASEHTLNIAHGFVLTNPQTGSGGITFLARNADLLGTNGYPVSWGLAVGAPVGQTLGLGDYEDATAFYDYSKTHPRLELSGGTDSIQGIRGNFQVYEEVYDDGGHLTHFAADFAQTITDTQATARGQVRYRSTVPVAFLDGVAEFAASTYTGYQDSGHVLVTVNRLDTHAGSVSVAYSTADGTAVAGQDFEAVSGVLTWQLGEATPKSFVIPVRDNQRADGVNKTAAITLSASASGPVAKAQFVIAGSQTPLPSVSVFTSVKATNPGAVPAVITLTRTGDLSAPLNVFYSVAGNAVPGTDYQPLKGHHKIPAGKASVSVKIVAYHKWIYGPSHKVKLILQPQPTYLIPGKSKASVSVSGT